MDPKTLVDCTKVSKKWLRIVRSDKLLRNIVKMELGRRKPRSSHRQGIPRFKKSFKLVQKRPKKFVTWTEKKIALRI